jgi:hypothetical protein
MGLMTVLCGDILRLRGDSNESSMPQWRLAYIVSNYILLMLSARRDDVAFPIQREIYARICITTTCMEQDTVITRLTWIA